MGGLPILCSSECPFLAHGAVPQCPRSRRVLEGKRTKDTLWWTDLLRSPALLSCYRHVRDELG
jgi:hypothetical protein